jgi:hypothetical protein
MKNKNKPGRPTVQRSPTPRWWEKHSSDKDRWSKELRVVEGLALYALKSLEGQAGKVGKPSTTAYDIYKFVKEEFGGEILTVATANYALNRLEKRGVVVSYSNKEIAARIDADAELMKTDLIWKASFYKSSNQVKPEELARFLKQAEEHWNREKGRSKG